ncbi:uncharacterized protein UBRO_00288 [Ustilago bromivora]|uniref:Uncharacterized protein n=1 Tax=Ustilago bromivora TaxID=307758 RepID=A0A1K0FXW8_9BASI|nr:uncharacterized protein UBRO_00288 [Ustilago bromivora]SYW76666.1 uncharacterized protein UBRO2_01503 [Ustilago bromivora]
MSQTPSRRRSLAVDTPGSARSNTSTSSNTDRATLLDRIEDLDLQIHDLRRQIAAERKKRRSSIHSSTSLLSSSSASLSLSFLDPDQLRDGRGIKSALLEKLKLIDDEALTSLLTASREGLVRWIATNGSASAEKAESEERGKGWVNLGLVPSKSVGVEGTGSGSDIDKRLALQQGNGRGGKKGRGVREELGEKRHEQSVHDWLKDRQRRTTSLVDSLTRFTHLDISNVAQTDTAASSDGLRARKVHIEGSFARLFPIDMKFSVSEDSSSSASSPQIQNLAITLPSWLKETLDEPHKLYSKLLKRNDLPSILLMLRTMLPLLSLRRNLYTSLMEQYTNLVREHVRTFESTTGTDFIPYHPHNTSSRKRTSTAAVDEDLARSLILPSLAEPFVLQNGNGAKLTIQFVIRWNRWGYATPNITVTAEVPGKMLDARSRSFLDGFEEEVQHLLKVAIAQDGIVGLPDKDEEEEQVDEAEEKVMGRWGVAPALNAVVKAFFGLESEESASGSEESA